jgi:hypothetical protein
MRALSTFAPGGGFRYISSLSSLLRKAVLISIWWISRLLWAVIARRMQMEVNLTMGANVLS